MNTLSEKPPKYSLSIRDCFDNYDELLEMVYGVEYNITNISSSYIIYGFLDYLKSNECYEDEKYSEINSISLGTINELMKLELKRYKRSKKLNDLLL